MISKHVAYKEVIRSDTAKRRGIKNIPSEEQLARIKILCEKVFEPLREHLNVPIFLSSVFRSPELNKAMGGANGSQHMANWGAAMDLDAQTLGGTTNMAIFNYIKDNLEFDQLIGESWDDHYDDYAWIHVSYHEGYNRGEILIMERINGKTTYRKYQ